MQQQVGRVMQQHSKLLAPLQQLQASPAAQQQQLVAMLQAAASRQHCREP
jgi:hypothetical protein